MNAKQRKGAPTTLPLPPVTYYQRQSDLDVKAQATFHVPIRFCQKIRTNLIKYSIMFLLMFYMYYQYRLQATEYTFVLLPELYKIL